MSNNEDSRIAILDRLELVRSGPNPAFDRVTLLAQHMFGVPISLVSLIDTDRQWFASSCGLNIDSTPREQAFCTYTIEHDSVFVVPDARTDRRFSSSPLVTGEPRIRFYAGAPLTVAPGIRIGSLCIIDTRLRDFTPDDMRRLAGLAGMIVGEIWLHGLELDVGMNLPIPSIGPTQGSQSPETAPITGPQLRAARGLLNWSVAQLAAATHVSPSTIKRIEASEKPLPIRNAIATSIRSAFTDNGIFLYGGTHASYHGAMMKINRFAV